MTLNEMIDLCKSKHKTKEEYIKIRDQISQEYDNLSEEEQEILSDALESLEMLIEWM